jgi:hypothetical protein
VAIDALRMVRDCRLIRPDPGEHLFMLVRIDRQSRILQRGAQARAKVAESGNAACVPFRAAATDPAQAATSRSGGPGAAAPRRSIEARSVPRKQSPAPVGSTSRIRGAGTAATQWPPCHNSAPSAPSVRTGAACRDSAGAAMRSTGERLSALRIRRRPASARNAVVTSGRRLPSSTSSPASRRGRNSARVSDRAQSWVVTTAFSPFASHRISEASLRRSGYSIRQGSTGSAASARRSAAARASRPMPATRTLPLPFP